MNSPQDKEVEKMLHSGRLTAGGFFGPDRRTIADIIAEDLETLSNLRYKLNQVVARMQALRDLARPALGNWVKVNDVLQVKSDDFKGHIACPWSCGRQFEKRITTAQRLDSNQSICWSDLNIHLIEEHRFFEGKGAFFRVDPAELVRIIF